MKIGILTFHRPINYGAFLQSYALSNRLVKEFPNCDVEIIDYIAPKEKKKIYVNILRRIKKQGIVAGIDEIKKIRKFQQSLEYLILSQKKICTNKLEKLFEYIDSEYDVLVIGSDAVFNWNQNGYPTAFIPDYDFSIPLYTYAASVHGLRFYEESAERCATCGKSFMKMKQVFTRDRCTEWFVKYCASDCNVQHACDPTFLIDFQQLYGIKHRDMQIIREKYKVDRPYIVLMVQNDELSRVVYEQYHKDFVLVALFINNRYSDCFMKDLNPIEWSMVLKNATVVVTSYFHGTLLTLQQGIPAIAIDVSHYNDNYEGKLQDLMVYRLEIPELYFQIEDVEVNADKLLFRIDESINGTYDSRIKNGVEKERKSFKYFLEQLSDCIQKEEKKE